MKIITGPAYSNKTTRLIKAIADTARKQHAEGTLRTFVVSGTEYSFDYFISKVADHLDPASEVFKSLDFIYESNPVGLRLANSLIRSKITKDITGVFLDNISDVVSESDLQRIEHCFAAPLFISHMLAPKIKSKNTMWKRWLNKLKVKIK